MSICKNCGCSKPCSCDGYTPDTYNNCIKCGCTKPCACDQYSDIFG